MMSTCWMLQLNAVLHVYKIACIPSGHNKGAITPPLTMILWYGFLERKFCVNWLSWNFQSKQILNKTSGDKVSILCLKVSIKDNSKNLVSILSQYKSNNGLENMQILWRSLRIAGQKCEEDKLTTNINIKLI